MISAITVLGVKRYSIANNLITALCVCIIIGVIFGGIPYVDRKNWTDDFMPFGVSGIFAGAATVYMAFVGFDSIANLSEEVKKPSKDLPIGIVGSLIICTLLYTGVSLIVTGMVRYDLLRDTDAPLSEAFAIHGIYWAEIFISMGAFFGLTTTILTLLAALPRVIMCMGLDGLLPHWLGDVNPRFQTPMKATVLAGAMSMVLSIFVNIEFLAELVALPILTAFTMVCSSVLIMRHEPSREGSARSFSDIP